MHGLPQIHLPFLSWHAQVCVERQPGGADCSVSLTHGQWIKEGRKDAFLREIQVPPQSEPISSNFSSDCQRSASPEISPSSLFPWALSIQQPMLLFSLGAAPLISFIPAPTSLRCSCLTIKNFIPLQHCNLKQNYMAQRNLGTVTWFMWCGPTGSRKNKSDFSVISVQYYWCLLRSTGFIVWKKKEDRVKWKKKNSSGKVWEVC